MNNMKIKHLCCITLLKFYNNNLLLGRSKRNLCPLEKTYILKMNVSSFFSLFLFHTYSVYL